VCVRERERGEGSERKGGGIEGKRDRGRTQQRRRGQERKSDRETELVGKSVCKEEGEQERDREKW